VNSFLKFFGLLALIALIFIAYCYVFLACWNNGVVLAFGLKEIEFSTSAWMMAMLIFFQISTSKFPKSSDS
jgi:hypothetical protein